MIASRIAIVLTALLVCVECVAAPKAEDAAFARAQRGAALYRAGRFHDAAQVFHEAYALYPEPTLLYNEARALDSGGELEGAIAAFRRYLEVGQHVSDRPAVEARIATLERQQNERREQTQQVEAARRAEEARRAEAAVAPSPAPIVRAPRPSRARRAAPFIVLGIGAAGLIAGAGLGGAAIVAHDDATRASTDAITATTQLDRARTLGLGATIALSAGGVVAGAGLIWAIVDVARARRAREPR